jgi:hypothetical protein
MNNKGLTWGVFLALIVAVAIIALLFFGPLKGIILEKIFPIANNLPRPGDVEQDKEIIGNVRYDIMTDSVQIYDGSTWNNFGKEMEFPSTGKISESELKANFNTYYFDKSKRTSPDLYADSTYTVKATEIAKSASLEPEKPSFWNIGGWIGYGIGQWTINKAPVYTRGSVISFVLKGTQQYGIFFTSLNGNIEFYGVVPSASDEAPPNPFNSNQMLTISSKTLEWRNSILKKPLTIKESQFCVTIREGRYLNVDLAEPGACNAT